LLPAGSTSRQPLLFLFRITRRAFFARNRCKSRVANCHGGAAPVPPVRPGTGKLEKGIKTPLQCTFQASLQTASVWFRDRSHPIVFSLCAYASSPASRACEK